MATRRFHRAQTLTLTYLSPSSPHRRSRFPGLLSLSLSKSALALSSSCHSPLRILPVLRFSVSGHGDGDGDGTKHDEAREAIMLLLREHGASERDSAFIAANSPGYVRMIVDGVEELDGLQLWDSWDDDGAVTQGGVGVGGLGFGEKVYYMAKSKGDGGILPFLESLGVRLSSAKVIVSYLKSDTLPNLLHKVQFLKEALYSGDVRKTYIGRNAKRMMVKVTIQADEDIQSTLAFFQKMEARHGGLQALGHESISFPLLIESFPRLLLCSVEDHLERLFELLASIGVPRTDVASILLCFPPAFFYDLERTLKPRISALEKVWDKEDIPKMLIKYPWILSACILANYKQILTFFNKEKVSKRDADVAIQNWPHILGLSVQRLNKALDCFNEISVRKKRLVPVITSSPQLLLRKPSEFFEVVAFFEEMGFDRPAIGKILCRSPEIFAGNVEKTLRRKIKFLIDFGFSIENIPRIVQKYPEFILLDTNATLQPRLEYLISVGLSKPDVCSMIHRFSPILGYSVEHVIEPKLEFLFDTMRKPLSEVVEYPRYFSYSLEDRIRPRFFIVKSRNLECSLKEMLAKNDDEFAEEFMSFGRLLLVPNKIKV